MQGCSQVDSGTDISSSIDAASTLVSGMDVRAVIPPAVSSFCDVSRGLIDMASRCWAEKLLPRIVGLGIEL